MLAIMRWTFIVIGVVTAAAVLFSYLFEVNESIYDPSRVTFKALGEFVKENLNVAAQYSDLLVAGDVESVDEIKAIDSFNGRPAPDGHMRIVRPYVGTPLILSGLTPSKHATLKPY